MVTVPGNTPANLPLLAACAAAPDDDLPRLVLADWYEENGDAARASLIRTSIAVVRCEPCKGIGVLFSGLEGSVPLQAPCMACSTLRRQERLLLAAVAANEIHRLVKLLPEKPHRSYYGRNVYKNVSKHWSPPLLEYERGLISRVRCRLGGWRHFGPLVSHHPLRGVVLVGKTPQTFEARNRRYTGWKRMPSGVQWYDCGRMDVPHVLFSTDGPNYFPHPPVLFDGDWWGWTRAEHAVASLSRQAIRWARQTAGILSSVPFPPEKP